MIRIVFAILTGLIVAIFLIWLIQTLSHSVYPPPAGLDLNNPEQLQEFIKNLPTGAFVFLISSYALGTLLGGWVACLIAADKPWLYAAIIGAFVLTGTVMNIMAISHPTWFIFVTIPVIIAMAWLASKLGAGKKAQSS